MYDNGTFYELEEAEVLAHPEDWDWHDALLADGHVAYIYCTNADWSFEEDDPQNDWGTIMAENGAYSAWNTSIHNKLCYSEEEFEESTSGLEAAMAHIEETIDRTPKQ